jgi:uncharacterized protein (DUF924 family)
MFNTVHYGNKSAVELPNDNPNSILNFWFGDDHNQLFKGLWWHGISLERSNNYPKLMSLQDTDEYIGIRWGELLKYYIDLKQEIDLFKDDHLLRYWLDTIDGKVALMILFDQFTRNAFRGTANSFKLDHYALIIAKDLLENQDLKVSHKYFGYVALMHSENDVIVNASCFGLLKLANDLSKEIDVKWENTIVRTTKVANEHLNILTKFGRYCHRNIVLGRESTSAEIEYLSRNKLPSWIKNAINYQEIKKIDKKKEPQVNISVRKKLRILVLHGIRQTGKRLKSKIEKYINQELSSIAEFIYCDAPHIYNPKGEARDISNVGHTKSWWNASDNPETMVYQGMEESIEYIDTLFRNESFDGIYGFSQGGSLTGIISALVDCYRKGIKIPISVDNISRHLKFVIIISGFYCRDTRPEFNQLMLISPPEHHSSDEVYIKTDSIDIPSFHSWGMSDKRVDPWRSEKLSQAFSNRIINTHLSTHFAQAIKHWPLKNMYKWLNQYVSQESESIESNDILERYKNDEYSLDDIRKISHDNPATTKDLAISLISLKHFDSEKTTELLKTLYSTQNLNEIAGNLFKILHSRCELWQSMIVIDTHGYQGKIVTDDEKRSDFRQILVKTICEELISEYSRCVVNNISKVPSISVKYFPNYNVLFRRTKLFRDIAFELGQHFNIFDKNRNDLANVTEEKMKFSCYIQYKKMTSELRRMLKDLKEPIRQRKRIPREELEIMVKRPISDFVLNPRAEPVNISTHEMMQPLYDYLINGEPHGNKEMQFTRGTVCNDKRLDLCKQVIGPNGVNDLMSSLEKDSLMSDPKVKHLLLGNNVCGNGLGKSIGKFIKSGKSALTSWYIAGNDMDEKGIKPVCEALCGDRQVEQLWLKRNPIESYGIPHLTKLLNNNDYLKVLDLTNTGLLDKGAVSLFKGGLGSITHLYIGSNGLTHKSIETLSHVIHDSNLTSISIGCNRLCDTGATLFAEILKDPRCKLLSLEIASSGIGPKGASALGKSLKVNKTLVCLNIGFLKSTVDLGEIPNILKNEGGIAIAESLIENTTLRSIDMVHTSLNKETISKFANILANHNDTLIHLNIEQFGVPHNELTREIIRTKIKKNCDLVSKFELDRYNIIIDPPHLENIRSVYRIQ